MGPFRWTKWRNAGTLSLMPSLGTVEEIASRFTSYALIDLDALAHNVRALLQHIGPRVEMFAVVKANAYGHGAPQVAHVALEHGARRLAVARTGEGVQLRRAGITAPILNMCYTVPAEAEAIISAGLTATVSSLEGAQALSQRAVALGRQATIHIKVDTGMGRYGLLPQEVLPFLEQVSRLPHLDIEGIFTHFAVADSRDKTYTRRQFAIFSDVLHAAQEAGYRFRLRHAANSAATLDLPEMHLDAVRPGIALYGLYPSSEVSREVPLHPVMSIRSHVARVRLLPAGSSVSYGRTFIAARPTRVVLVPLGYGDGYHRLLSNRASVLIRGQRSPIIGRICMDQLMVDATHIPEVQQDDEVVLLGEQGGEAISAEEVAALAETINYEVVTSLAARIPRLYVRGGEVVEIVEVVG